MVSIDVKKKISESRMFRRGLVYQTPTKHYLTIYSILTLLSAISLLTIGLENDTFDVVSLLIVNDLYSPKKIFLICAICGSSLNRHAI